MTLFLVLALCACERESARERRTPSKTAPRSTPASAPTTAPVASGPAVMDVVMFSTAAGWARTKGRVFRTTDGGTWREVGVPGVRTVLAGAFPDAETGWVFGLRAEQRFPDVFVTDDGGATWVRRRLPRPRFNSFGPSAFPIAAIDARRAWAGVDSALFTTTDGGASWTPLRPRAAHLSRPALTQVTFSTPRTGFANLGPTRLYRTEDGGRTWRPIRLVLPKTVRGNAVIVSLPRFSAEGTGVTEASVYVIDRASVVNASVVFFVTTDDGRTWRPTTPITTQGFLRFGSPPTSVPAAVVSGSRWLAASPPGLVVTEQGGASWFDVPAHVDLSGVAALSFVDADHGWAALGGLGCEERAEVICSGIIRTDDGGLHWQQTTFTDS